MSKMLAIEPTTQTEQQKSMDRETHNLQEQIRMRAYELYESRGCIDGHHEEDWYQAENELRNPREVGRAA